MARVLAITLGILTAIGGFVDIGDIVANSQAGARFGMALAWVVVVGVLGICTYAEMAGRVAAVSGRPVFDVVRERLGPRAALANLVGSYLVTVLTLGAEIGGVALAVELATSVHYLLWVPIAGFVVWVVLWRVRFETLERVFGLAGLTLVVFIVALFQLDTDWAQFQLDTDWAQLWGQASHPTPAGHETWATYGFQGVALFAAAMTPYEVFFFSSGAVEERWGPRDLAVEKANVFVGFPLGGVLSLGLMGTAAVIFHPIEVRMDTLGQTALPAALALGKLGLAARGEAVRAPGVAHRTGPGNLAARAPHRTHPGS